MRLNPWGGITPSSEPVSTPDGPIDKASEAQLSAFDNEVQSRLMEINDGMEAIIKENDTSQRVTDKAHQHASNWTNAIKDPSRPHRRMDDHPFSNTDLWKDLEETAANYMTDDHVNPATAREMKKRLDTKTDELAKSFYVGTTRFKYEDPETQKKWTQEVKATPYGKTKDPGYWGQSIVSAVSAPYRLASAIGGMVVGNGTNKTTNAPAWAPSKLASGHANEWSDAPEYQWHDAPEQSVPTPHEPPSMTTMGDRARFNDQAYTLTRHPRALRREAFFPAQFGPHYGYPSRPPASSYAGNTTSGIRVSTAAFSFNPRQRPPRQPQSELQYYFDNFCQSQAELQRSQDQLSNSMADLRDCVSNAVMSRLLASFNPEQGHHLPSSGDLLVSDIFSQTAPLISV